MIINGKFLKDLGDKFCVDIPGINIQLRQIFIILISVFFIIMILYFTRIYESGSRIPFDVFLLFLFPILLLGIYAYGFSKKYVFDLNRKQVMVYSSFFFAPHNDIFCNFNKIATFGIKCKKERIKSNSNKPRWFFYYYLVFVTKDKPNDFIELISTFNISYEISLKDLNDLGNRISEILKCGFIEGQEKMTIANANGVYKNIPMKLD